MEPDVSDRPLIRCNKVCHLTESAAEHHRQELLRRDNGYKWKVAEELHVYFCLPCQSYHVGHSGQVASARRKLLNVQYNLLQQQESLTRRLRNVGIVYKNALDANGKLKAENKRLKQVLHAARFFISADFSNEEKAALAFKKLMDAVEDVREEQP